MASRHAQVCRTGRRVIKSSQKIRASAQQYAAIFSASVAHLLDVVKK